MALDLHSDLCCVLRSEISETPSAVTVGQLEERDCVNGNLSKCHTDTQTKEIKSSDLFEDLDKSSTKPEDCPRKSMDFTVEILAKSEDCTINPQISWISWKNEDLPWINLRIYDKNIQNVWNIQNIEERGNK